jgi:hypothetical protein
MTVQRLYHHQLVCIRNPALSSAGMGDLPQLPTSERRLKARPDKPVAVVREDRIMMRPYAALLVLVAHCFICQMAAAAQSKDCKVGCRDDYNACVQAHTQGACKTNYDICVKHCPNK